MKNVENKLVHSTESTGAYVIILAESELNSIGNSKIVKAILGLVGERIKSEVSTGNPRNVHI